MELAELSADQRRRLVDATQAFEAWRDAGHEFRHSYRGSMRWKTVNQREYLYRVYGKIGQSLGPRSPGLEQVKNAYTEQRTKLRRRLTTLEKRLKEMTRLNRAANLGRVPVTAARILRKLDAEGLLGKHLFVVGTNSLYAYEAASGVLFDAGLTATEDVDLLWDARRHLSLALSRAAHNAQIIESNKQKEQDKAAGGREHAAQNPRAQPAPREDEEKRQLREAQGEARKAMHREQQRDRDALRLAQDAQKLEHQKWSKQLYAGAREAAFQKVKEQYADKWEAVRGTENRKQREKAAAALKLEEKKSYECEATLQVNQCRPEKDAAWKAMQIAQEKERLDLRNLHRQETSALARQHIAERLGVHEKWRALSLDKQANRIDARLTTHQGMAAQQKAALDAIKLHARASKPGKANGAAAAPANPREASRAYMETARAEQGKHAAMRDKLLKTRAQNLERAGPEAQKNLDRSAGGEFVSGGAANGFTAGKGPPREIIAPGIHAARGERASSLQQRLSGIDPQQQIRQAAGSAQTLSSEERANASPEIKESLARKDRQAKDRSFFTDANSRQEDRGKGGRNGGGRGR